MNVYKPFLEVIKEMKDGDIADSIGGIYASLYLDNGHFFAVMPHEEKHNTRKWDISKEDFNIYFKIRK